MRALFWLLLPISLVGQELGSAQDLALDLRTELGSMPAESIRLAPRGCWDELLQGAAAPRSVQTSSQRRRAEATVEVWGVSFQESLRTQTFRLFLDDVRISLTRALASPPASHTSIELSELMASDPSNPQGLDLTKVQSLQNRFNRQPPNGSPLK